MRPAEDRPVAVQKPLLEKPCRHLWHLHHAAKPCRCRVKGIRGRIKGARMLVKREGRPHKRLLSFIRAGRKGVEVDIVCLLPERRGPRPEEIRTGVVSKIFSLMFAYRLSYATSVQRSTAPAIAISNCCERLLFNEVLDIHVLHVREGYSSGWLHVSV
jgi:hypothetical protein